jgi:hypothetical protein
MAGLDAQEGGGAVPVLVLVLARVALGVDGGLGAAAAGTMEVLAPLLTLAELLLVDDLAPDAALVTNVLSGPYPVMTSAPPSP